MKHIRWLLFFGALALSAATVFRVDPAPVMTTAGTAPPGGYPALYAVANASITVTTDVAGTMPAVTYTDATGSTACPVSAPVVLPGTALCTPSTGAQGQFGFWMTAGNYYFKTVLPNGNVFGPFPITVAAPTTGQINGAPVPTSQNPVSTNSAGQFVDASVQGNGAYVQMAASGGTTTNDFAAFDVYGNVVDSRYSAASIVTSFKSRNGAVTPQTGDYTYSQIGGAIQGNTSVPQMAGGNSGLLGALLCDDAYGNATTTGCNANFVTSFNGRLGAVLPATGDYSYSQISGPTQGNTTKPQMAGVNSGTIAALLCNDANGNATTVGCGAAGGVTSFNTRTGAVLPASGDYTYSQIGGPTQGNTTKPQMAGSNSGATGALLCNDSSGNATTTGCSSAVAGVSSFNTRTGAVVPATGDYTYSQIGGATQGNTTKPQMAGTNSGTTGALLCNDSSGNATTTGCSSAVAGVSSFNTRTGAVVSQTGDYTYSQIGGSTQGNTTKPQMAGTNSGTAGALLCDDANGNATTSGCSGGGSSSGPTGAIQLSNGSGGFSGSSNLTGDATGDLSMAGAFTETFSSSTMSFIVEANASQSAAWAKFETSAGVPWYTISSGGDSSFGPNTGAYGIVTIGGTNSSSTTPMLVLAPTSSQYYNMMVGYASGSSSSEIVQLRENSTSYPFGEWVLYNGTGSGGASGTGDTTYLESGICSGGSACGSLTFYYGSSTAAFLGGYTSGGQLSLYNSSGGQSVSLNATATGGSGLLELLGNNPEIIFSNGGDGPTIEFSLSSGTYTAFGAGIGSSTEFTIDGCTLGYVSGILVSKSGSC